MKAMYLDNVIINKVYIYIVNLSVGIYFQIYRYQKL